MSIPDSLLEHYFKLLTDISDEEWATLSESMESGSLNPMEAKKLLARILVTLLHSKDEARASQEQFEQVFSSGKLPDAMPELTVARPTATQPWVELLVVTQMSKSKREAREHITNGALRLQSPNGEWEQVTDINADLPSQDQFVIKLGKRKFASIHLTQ